MKKLLTTILALILFVHDAKAFHEVWGDFWYDFQGANATVLYLRNATKSEYGIPEKALYESNGDYISYIVNKIADNAFAGKTRITSMSLPETMEIIGSGAFSKTHISSMIIPKSVKTFGDTNSFSNCDLLTTLIYLPLNAPANWIATTKTYVPDKQSYSSPRFSINKAEVIEMISFDKSEFEYTGQAPSTTWTNNVKGYTATFKMPLLKTNVGTYEDTISVSFRKEGGGGDFWTKVIYRYTIKPAVIKVKAKNNSREYGEENPTLTATAGESTSGRELISPPPKSQLSPGSHLQPQPREPPD